MEYYREWHSHTETIYRNLYQRTININDNRRHVHIFYKGKRDQECAAKFWIEANGEKCIEIAYSKLSAKENEAIMKAIDKNWEFINDQIDKTFAGIKTVSKKLK